jgi:predicted PurR-regulated permease PerM
MPIDTTTIIISISAAILGGFGTAIVNAISQAKREQTRKLERYQDQLKLELKDLKIQLYQLEKDLTEWKDKYYSAIQQLIEVRAELEETLVKLSIIHIEHEHDNEEE